MKSLIRKPEFGIFLFSAVVFAHTLFTNLDHGFWFDEVVTLKFADVNWSMAQSINWWSQFDNHPYGYYLMLRGWLHLTAMDEIGAKLLNPLLFLLLAFASYCVWPKARRAEYFYFLSLMLTSAWVIFYLIEIRMYGTLVSISLFSASCIYAIQYHATSSMGDPGTVGKLFNYLVVSVIFLIALDSWGTLFGGSMIICVLARFEILRTQVRAKWGFYLALSFLVLLLGFQYLHILTLYNGLTTLKGFPEQLSAWQFFSMMMTEYWQQSFVTVRSRIIVIAALATWVVMVIWGRHNPRDEIILFVAPVALTYLIVILINSIIGSAFFKNYVALQLVPFVVMFFVATSFRSRVRTMASVFVVGLFLVANVGSIPFFEKFPDKPNSMQDVSNFRTSSSLGELLKLSMRANR